MNIVLINKEIKLFEYVANALIDQGANVYAIDPPEETGNRYLEEILMIKKEAGVDLLLSFDYYPNISLAAGALGVKYACIVTEDFDEKLFDKSVLNPWNYIFVSDSMKASKLLKLGQVNAFFLPFPCADYGERKMCAFTKTDENTNDALYNIFNDLSQKTKGYLDGFMAVMRQDGKVNTIFNSLNVFARKELETLVSFNEEASLESKGDYLDNAFLLPILADRTYSLMKNVIINDEIDLETLEKGGIVVSIPERTAGTGASFKEWQAIFEGKFLIASSVTDYSVLGDSKPVSYADRFELIRQIKYYLEHKKEREEYALKVKEAALSLNNIETYLSFIIERLNNE
ncbi:MAG: hypothetical protein J6X48_04835 [Lachnospiraceae bacterium]|nr:hypothetical protein [Lachnospiraceae bacterium]